MRWQKKLLYQWGEFLRLEIPLRAAALAYHSLLGIVPVLGLCFWYLKTLNVTERWLGMTREFILSQLNVQSGSAFQTHFDKITGGVEGKSWGWIGLILFCYTTVSLISKFGESLDHILSSGVKKSESLMSLGRLWIRRTLGILGLPVALAISLMITQWVKKDSWLHAVFEIKTLGAILGIPVAWGTSIVAVFMVYYLIPRKQISWKAALKGACLVGPLSEAVRYGFGLYNHYAVSVHKIYGVLAVIPLFILWVQLSWILLLGGAFFVRTQTPTK